MNDFENAISFLNEFNAAGISTAEFMHSNMCRLNTVYEIGNKSGVIV